MLYEAYEELRNKRLERVRQQGVQQACSRSASGCKELAN